MGSVSNDQNKLIEEVEYIFSCLFPDKMINDKIKKEYVDFSFCFRPLRSEINMDKIIIGRLDIESIEFYLILKKRNNLLTQKIHGLIYLLEINVDFYGDFYSDKNSFFEGFLKLIYYTVRSCYKLVKGFLLVRIYGLI